MSSTPRRERPWVPPDYRGSGLVPPGEQGLLDWATARDRLAAAQSYWVTTTSPSTRPNPRPVWGLWPSSADIDALIDAWLAKYRSAGGNRDAMTGFDRAVYALRPHTAFGWTLDRFPGDATRWRFGDHEHAHPA